MRSLGTDLDEFQEYARTTNRSGTKKQRNWKKQFSKKKILRKYVVYMPNERLL